MLTCKNAGMSTSAHDAELERLALPAADVAKLLGISERHLWSMHSTGRLGPRPIALGRAKRWRVDEIRAWLAAGAPSRDKWLSAATAQSVDARSRRQILEQRVEGSHD